MTYRQIELDLRLDYERGLKDNIATVTKFAGQKMAEDLQEEGRPLTAVRTKQEAYGVLAQQFVRVSGKMRLLKGGMNDYLKALDGDSEAGQITASLYNSAVEMAQEAVIFAAHAKRILEDLYYGQTTPIEDALAAGGSGYYDDIEEEE